MLLDTLKFLIGLLQNEHCSQQYSVSYVFLPINYTSNGHSPKI